MFCPDARLRTLISSHERETRVAYDTDASASCDKRRNYWWQDDVLAAMDWAWHIASLCHLLVCGVHVLGGTETHEDVKRKHTEARDARCLHASERSQWSKKPRSQTMTIKPASRRSTPITFHRDFCLDDRKRDDIKPFKRKNQSIAVELRACCRSATKTSSPIVDDLFSNDLFPSSSALLFFRSLEPVASNVVKLHVCNGKTNNTHSMQREIEKQRGRPSSLRLLDHRSNIFCRM